MKRYVKASRGDGFIGIWWYTDEGEIWGVMKHPDDGVLSGPYVQYSDTENHLTLWSSVVKDNVNSNNKEIKLDAQKIINKGYKSLERGRVIYDTRTMCYVVVCSANLVNDTAFREAVVDYYQLAGNQIDFVQNDHYYKAELTGNLALDSFYYESMM